VSQQNKSALIVHGGAWDVPLDDQERCRAGAQRAIDRGWAVLETGGSAIDACEAAVIELEEDPVFDAGIGSHLNRDGIAQLDAIMMDGRTLKAGAVACVERIRNPIRLARRVLEKSEHMMLCGYGAELFAAENDIPLCDPSIFRIDSEIKIWSQRSGMTPHFGTVGAVALDSSGNLAAATSTGGTIFKYPGRIGDSPLVGCGCYADNEAAAVSSTGHGESIMKIVMAKMINDLVAAGRSPQEAVQTAVEVAQRRTAGRVGAIVVDRQGRIGAAFSTRNLVRASRTVTDKAAIVTV
jgi:beta-aspartyl-peptidase (threonine type)